MRLARLRRHLLSVWSGHFIHIEYPSVARYSWVAPARQTYSDGVEIVAVGLAGRVLFFFFLDLGILIGMVKQGEKTGMDVDAGCHFQP